MILIQQILLCFDSEK